MLVSILIVIIGILATSQAVKHGNGKIAFMAGFSTIAAFAATI